MINQLVLGLTPFTFICVTFQCYICSETYNNGLYTQVIISILHNMLVIFRVHDTSVTAYDTNVIRDTIIVLQPINNSDTNDTSITTNERTTVIVL